MENTVFMTRSSRQEMLIGYYNLCFKKINEKSQNLETKFRQLHKLSHRHIGQGLQRGPFGLLCSFSSLPDRTLLHPEKHIHMAFQYNPIKIDIALLMVKKYGLMV